MLHATNRQGKEVMKKASVDGEEKVPGNGPEPEK